MWGVSNLQEKEASHLYVCNQWWYYVMDFDCKISWCLYPIQLIMVSSLQNCLAKARQSLDYLCHSIWGATTAVKSVGYKFLVRPLLEYTCQVWSLHTAWNKSVLEGVQCHAAKWACGNLWDPSSKRWSKLANHLMNV